MSIIVESFLSEWGIEVDQDSVDEGLDALSAIGKGLAGLVAAGAAAAVGLALVVSKIAGDNDELGKSARNFGAGVDEFQKIRTAAELSGLEIDGVADSFATLIKSAYDAVNGSKEMSAQFNKLGINAKEFLKLSPTEQLLEMSEALKGIDSPAQRVVIRMSLMGEAGLKMSSLLNGGREALQEMLNVQDQFGVLVTTEDLKLSEDYNDNLLMVGKFIKGFAQTLTSKLLPSVNKVFGKTKAWIKENKALVFSKVAKYTKILGEAIEWTADKMEILVNFVTKAIDKIGGFDNAVRLAAFAMVALTAGTLYFIRANLAAAVFKIARAFSVVRHQTLLANAAVLVIPLAIGTIIALVALLIEDFVKFKQGQDSIIGRLVDKYVWFSQVVGFLSQVADDVGDSFGDMADFVGDVLDQLFIWVDKMTDGIFGSVVEELKSFAEQMGRVILPVLEIGASFLGWDQGAISDVKKMLSGDFDFGISKGSPRKQQADALAAANNGVFEKTVVTVNAAPNHSEREIGKHVALEVDRINKDNARAIRKHTGGVSR